ncbi:agamous-like MADS-box protein AGL82 [Syzygium oleosum]|uniref:agamous-like MADS-box protein AGL82 n=1 Tax=Syzygium oleosum TaxID=219896 RepID=UPI0024B979B7|nr:agamous-like MADS-box protein AGL82 [Syzygium oleosum]
MGRAKVKLELISNSRSRRITFEKRKKGLMKKAETFKTLCGVDTCVIIYPMRMSGDGLVQPEIWPSDSKEVERIVCRYRSEAADRRAKRATGLREFFASRKEKIDAELAEARKVNWEAKYPVSDEFLKDLSGPQLRSLLSAVGDRLEQAKTRLATMKEKRTVETAAPSDEIVPSIGVDLHASNAGFMQDGVVGAGLPFEFMCQQLDQSMSIP